MTFDEWWADRKNWQRHIGVHKKFARAAWRAGKENASTVGGRDQVDEQTLSIRLSKTREIVELLRDLSIDEQGRIIDAAEKLLGITRLE